MTRVLLHIGAHKTATTYVQLTLDALSAKLAQHGILYPSIWREAGSPGHAGLPRAIVAGDSATLRAQAAALLHQAADVIVISAEDLETLKPAQVARLKELFAGAEMRIVYHVRRWPEMVRSTWQESVKHGNTLTLPEFIAGQMLNLSQSRVLNIGVVLQPYSEVFGIDAIRIVSYSHLVDRRIDIAAHFLGTFLDVSDGDLPVTGRPNASLDMGDAEAIRVLNSIHRQRGGTASAALRNWYLVSGRSLLLPVLRAMQGHIGPLEIDEASSPLRGLHQELRQRYAAATVPPAPEFDFYEPRKSVIRYVRPDYLTGLLIRDLVEHAYQQFLRDR